MTFAEIKAEITARGYDYVAAARIASFAQRAYRVICSRYDWPFLEAETTGSAPLELPSARSILSVKDVTNDRNVTMVDRRWIVSERSNLTDAGQPEYAYLEGETLKAYPVDSSELAVRYARRPPTLTDSDEPLMPEAWHGLIVDLACVYCLRDDDEGEEARAMKLDVEEGIREMVADLMGRNHQGPSRVIRTGHFFDYL